MKHFLKSFGKAILYFLAYSLFQAIAGLVAGIFIAVKLLLINGDSLLTDAAKFMEVFGMELTQQTTVIILFSNLLALLAVWLFFVIRKKKLFREIQLEKCSVKNIIASITLAIGLAIVLNFVLGLIPFSEDILEAYEANSVLLRSGNFVITFITVAFLVPIVEEVFFRGLIYTRLKSGMNMIVAAILSSFMFGIGHADTISIISAFIAGITLVWVFETTKSLYPCIAIHMTNNAISQLLPEQLVVPDFLEYIILGTCAVLLVGSIIYLKKNNTVILEKPNSTAEM